MKLKEDLSEYHETIGDLFPRISASEAWERYSLSKDQIAFFKENGYLANVKILESESQINTLLQELDEIKEPSHPRNHLFYEFHTNESSDPNAVLFHSLGHWRITSGFHDVLWNPAF